MNKEYFTGKSARFIAVIVFPVLLVCGQALGQEPEGLELGKITVTNRRSSMALGDATENVAIAGQDEILRAPAASLGEALGYMPGVDVAPTAKFGQPASLSIQGCDSRQVRMMIDGIPLNSQSSGQVNPEMFPFEDIGRIEVIKGASSSVWGSSLGGVINVITKDTGTTLVPQGEISTSFAEFHTRKESAELSGKVQDAGYYLFFSHMESAGAQIKSDSLEKKGFGKLSYDLKEKGMLVASFGYSGADVNSGVFPGGSYQAQPYQARYGKLGWQIKSGTTDTKLDLKHSRQSVTTKSFLSETDAEPVFMVRTTDALYQVSWNSAFRPRNKDLFVAGLDADWDILKSDMYLSKAKQVNLQAPYVNYTLRLGSWDLNSGMRYDRNSEFGAQASPSFGALYHFKGLAHTTLKGTVSRAFNAPPLLWKFNENALLGTAPNPAIKPERAWVYQAAFETKVFSRLGFNASLYRSNVRDALALDQNESGLFIMRNFKKFTRQGGELGCRLRLGGGLTLSSSAAFNDIRDTTIKDNATGKIVKGGGKPRESFNAGIEYQNQKGFSLYIKGYYYNWNEPASSQSNDRKMLCDLKASQAFGNFSLFVAVHNLANSKYWQDYFFPLPRRYFEGGTTLKW